LTITHSLLWRVHAGLDDVDPADENIAVVEAESSKAQGHHGRVVQVGDVIL